MASRVAGKIKLQSVDELLGVPEIAGTQEIEIGRIHSFPNHPFKVLDDEKMDRATVKSYRKMREDALNGEPTAKERYEKTLAMRREAYHSKKSEQTA